MKQLFYRSLLIGTLVVSLAAPIAASAHEVYVLDHDEIAHAVSTPSPNPFDAIPSNEKLFLGYGAVIGFAVIVLMFISVSPFLERICDPFLARLKRYAPIIARVTLGTSVIASGYFGAVFGPELPLTQLFPDSLIPTMGVVIMIAGVCITVGLLTRVMAILGAILFTALVVVDKSYMLTYMSYFGEFVLFIILGGGEWSLDSAIPFFRRIDAWLPAVRETLEKYSFFIMRVLFGASLFFASFYAKFLHSNLAMETVSQYHLTNYFPFTPLFLVLGAFIVEALIGFAFAAGIELRFTAIVFTIFLTLSISFFGESVWPHVILFGVNLAIFCHGYDRYTVESAYLQRKRAGEPVL